MTEAGFRQGDILAYPYLWNWQARRGETEGRKDRPVCVALPLRKDGVTHLFLLAITSTAPRSEQAALEIPETEQRRAGLKDRARGWVILDECNYDIAERSFYLDASSPTIGRFSEAFTTRIKDALRALIDSRSLLRIDRTGE